MNKVLIIMLANTSDDQMREMTNTALNTAYANKGNGVDLKCILVETNSNSPGYEQDWVWTVYPHEQFNYNKFLNIGYRYSWELFPDFFPKVKNGDFGEYVVVANNDLVFHENWAEILISSMDDNADLDSVSPISPGWVYHSDINEEWRIHRGFEIGRHFCGWLQMYHMRVWQKLFPLDERFSFWAQDNDIAIRMSKMGMTHALVSTSRVTHLTSRSHNLIPPDKYHEWTHGMGIILSDKINNGEYENN